MSEKKLWVNVTKLVLGSGGSQLLQIISIPFIARLYGPENIGILGVFLSISGILTIIISLMFHLVIQLPKTRKHAIEIALVALIIVVVFSLLLTLVSIVLLCANWRIPLEGKSLLFIPLYVLFLSFSNVLLQLHFRFGKFTEASKITFVSTLIVVLSKLILFYMIGNEAVSLIIATLLGVFFSLVVLMSCYFVDIYGAIKNLTIARFVIHVMNNIDIIRYRAPQTLINNISQNIPTLFIGAYFGMSSVGYFSMAKTVLGVPIMVIGKSISDVFYPRFSSVFKTSNKEAYSLLVKFTKSLSLIALLPLLGVVIFSKPLIPLILGDEWADVAYYIIILSPWYYLIFSNRAAIATISVLKLEKFFLKYELVSLSLRSASLFLAGTIISSNIYYALIGFVISSTVLNTYLILKILKRARLYAV